MVANTLYDKLWDRHLVGTREDGAALLYIDRHLLHEVTSPQAFAGLRRAGRRPWRAAANIATVDHNVPTTPIECIEQIDDPHSRLQVRVLADNTQLFGIDHYGIGDPRQGIVHVIAPEQGLVLPGMTVVCGDSHTATNGALACLAHGIGTSEVEHVLATQCLVSRKMANFRVRIEGALTPGVSAKDLALAMIGRIGAAGATGHALEYAGPTIGRLSMEGRMTLCNMAIEAGARAGLIGVDETTIDYVHRRPLAPEGRLWERAVADWRGLVSDPAARFDRELELRADTIAPQVTWGTSPDLVVAIDEPLPDPAEQPDPVRRAGMEQAYRYMGLRPGLRPAEIELDRVFIGSCTNSRIEDLRTAAALVKGRVRAERIRQVLVVPGSEPVRRQAEAEGLDRIFRAAGFEWRRPGCSMCLALNADRLQPGERCASTSNRNFEDRQGRGGRTHLVSPAMAAAAALHGHFVDLRTLS